MGFFFSGLLVKFCVMVRLSRAAATCGNEDTVCGLVLDQLNGDLMHILPKKKKKLVKICTQENPGAPKLQTQQLVCLITQLGIWPPCSIPPCLPFKSTVTVIKQEKKKLDKGLISRNAKQMCNN